MTLDKMVLRTVLVLVTSAVFLKNHAEWMGMIGISERWLFGVSGLNASSTCIVAGSLVLTKPAISCLSYGDFAWRRSRRDQGHGFAVRRSSKVTSRCGTGCPRLCIKCVVSVCEMRRG